MIPVAGVVQRPYRGVNRTAVGNVGFRTLFVSLQPNSLTVPDDMPPSLNIVLIGHSHVYAIWDAISAMRTDGAWPEDALLSFVPLKEKIYEPFLLSSPESRSDKIVINPRIVTDFRMFCAKPAKRMVVFTMLGGNQHNVISLANSGQPFDFVLDGFPEPVGGEAVDLVPAGVIRDLLLTTTRRYALAMEWLRTETTAPIFHLESPPPNPSNAHIAEHAGVLHDHFSRYGVASPTLRMKCWRLHSEIFRETCARSGIAFVPVPPESQDSNGFMVEKGWYIDPMHGNQWYGERVLRQMLALAGAGSIVER